LGGWGTGSFENDDAADWVGELGTISPKDLNQILAQAADSPDYLEAPAASVAVAAAEAVAALAGSPADAAPKEILDWTKKNPAALTPELKALASRALDRIRHNSELKDLWLQAEGLNDWTAAIQELQTRLAG